MCPKAPGGETVSITSGALVSAPATVQVLQKQSEATFDFAAGTTAGEETVTVWLNGTSASATVLVGESLAPRLGEL